MGDYSKTYTLIYLNPVRALEQKQKILLWLEFIQQIIIFQTYEAFLGGWSSASYIPRVGTPEYAHFEKEARSLFDRFAENGLIELKVTTLCFYGQLV